MRNVRLPFLLVAAVSCAACSKRSQAVAGTAPASESAAATPAAEKDDSGRQRELKASILWHSEQMQQAFLQRDFDKFVSYMHPDVVALMGGPEKVKATIEPGHAEMVRTAVRTTLGEVSEVVDDAGRLVAFIPVRTVYRYPDGGMIQDSYRIACSADGGASWTFLDGQGRQDQKDFFRKKFPVLTARIPFPKTSHQRTD